MLITADFGSVNTGASVYYRVLNPDKTVAVARTNSGVTELISGSGVYGVEVSDSTLLGKTVVWDIDGTSKAASETFPNWPLLVRTELATELARLDVDVSSRLAAASYVAPPDAATVAGAVRSDLESGTPIPTNIARVNGYPVTGEGTASNPWGPA